MTEELFKLAMNAFSAAVGAVSVGVVVITALRSRGDRLESRLRDLEDKFNRLEGAETAREKWKYRKD